MNYALRYLLPLLMAALIVACSPSESSLQTAIAETQSVQPAPTTVLALELLSEIRLEDVLLNDGDLPTVFVGQQIASQPPADIGEVPPPDQSINRKLRAGDFASDGVTILLYESIVDLQEAYHSVVGVVSGGSATLPLAGVGEEAVQSEESFGGLPLVGGQSIPSATSAKVVFTRCHALVYIDLFSSEANSAVAAEYAKRIDGRLEPLVCR